MLGKVLRAVALASFMGVLQSSALRFLAPTAVVPDLSLIVLVFFAHRNGAMPGQLAGFFTGLSLDLISLAPLGYFAFIYTLIGFLFGLSKDRVVLDGVVLPLVAVFVAALIKPFVAQVLAGVFSLDAATIRLIGARVWVEIGLTTLLASPAFAIMSLVGLFKGEQRGGFR